MEQNDLRKCKVIIGNGFDLHCGMKSKYGDYFEATEKRVEEFINSAYYSGFNEYGHYELENLSFWHILFHFVRDIFEDAYWWNIEKYLKDFFLRKSYKFDGESVSHFNLIRYEFMKFSKQRFLNPNESMPYILHYLKIKKAPFNSNLIAEFLLEELKIYEIDFGKYIRNNFEYTCDTLEYANLASDFLSFCEKMGTIVSIDTFNYTPIEKLDNLKTNNVCHINGVVEKPIFGIDSSNVPSNDTAYIFTKTHRRVMSDFLDDKHKIWPLKEEFDDVIIYGHSLDEQDYSYFFPIFESMNLEDINSNSRIIFVYSIYDSEKEEVIKQTNINSICTLIEQFSKRTKKDTDARLLDSLSYQGRIKIIEF